MPAPDAPSLYHLHHLLWEVNAAITPVSEDAFEDSELTLPLSGTLDLIGLSPGVTVAELSRVQPKTPQAISQLVAKLEKMGLIERRLGTGRGVGLYATPAGEQARADAIAREQHIEARLQEMLGTELYEELRATLERARPLLSETDTTQFVKVSDPRMTTEKPHLEPTAEHPITITPAGKHVVVKAGDVTIADTHGALSLAESNYPPVLYVPLADVDPAQIERSDHSTYCPYKGDAGYYNLPALGSLGDNAVWEYADPYPAVAEIKGTVAFYADRVEITEA